MFRRRVCLQFSEDVGTLIGDYRMVDGHGAMRRRLGFWRRDCAVRLCRSAAIKPVNCFRQVTTGSWVSGSSIEYGEDKDLGRRRRQSYQMSNIQPPQLSDDLGKSHPSSWVNQLSVVTTASSMSPIGIVQSTLLAAHGVLNGPWWFTIASCTLAFRFALVPITLSQIRSSGVFAASPASVKLAELNQNYLRDARGVHFKQRLSMVTKYYKEMFRIYRRFRLNPVPSVVVPLLQFGAFVSYILAARSLMASGGLDLSDQGMMWFPDLSLKDSTLLLPLAATICSYSSLEYSFKRAPIQATDIRLRPGDIFREAVQFLLVFGFPVIAQLPAGVFMYWIPSSMFGLAQAVLLKNPKVRINLGLVPKLSDEPDKSGVHRSKAKS